MHGVRVRILLVITFYKSLVDQQFMLHLISAVYAAYAVHEIVKGVGGW